MKVYDIITWHLTESPKLPSELTDACRRTGIDEKITRSAVARMLDNGTLVLGHDLYISLKIHQ